MSERRVSVSAETADLLRAGATVIPIDRIRYQDTRNLHPDWRGKVEPDPVWVALQQPCPTCSGKRWIAKLGGNYPCPESCAGRLWFTITTPCRKPECFEGSVPYYQDDNPGDVPDEWKPHGQCDYGEVPVVEASIVTITGTTSSPTVVLNTRPLDV